MKGTTGWHQACLEIDYPRTGIINFESEGQGNLVSLWSKEAKPLAGFGAEPLINPLELNTFGGQVVLRQR